MSADMPCPLCATTGAQHFHQDKRRQYWHCRYCDLVFVDPDQLPTPDAERHIYDQHENSPEDPHYRQFLNRLAAPLCERLGPDQILGLDFGCGPGPTLSVMLRERGLKVVDYDPIYAPGEPEKQGRYDFITCTEVMEHFHHPGRDWMRLRRLLKPGGWLGVMTKLRPGQSGFAEWHYKNDPTHVSFYSRRSFEFLARRDRFRVEFPATDIILLQRHATT